MKAMLLNRIGPIERTRPPLLPASIPDPAPGETDLLIRVSACGVCHTEVDEIEGRTPPPSLPVVPGHQVVGRVEQYGSAVRGFRTGDRVGVAWIFSACGRCPHCRSGNENLCYEFRATGRDVNGGYAEYMTVPAAFAVPIPALFTDVQAAPHLCAGAIGHRSLRLANLSNGMTLGLTGFGASAHLVLKLVRHLYPESRVYVFSRSERERHFALELGAVWAGDIGERSPAPLDRIIDTTPAWKPVVEALRDLVPGGRLVINAIRKENTDRTTLLELDYHHHLWMEKEVKSVANVSRVDVREFLAIAAQVPIIPEIQEYPLEEANQALFEMKERKIRGAKVLQIG